MSISPSSFAKGPRCGSGNISRTRSDGRQSFMPQGVIDRTVDQDGMRKHLIDQLRIGPMVRCEAKFRVWCSLFTE
jgi:hypothetical protein